MKVLKFSFAKTASGFMSLFMTMMTVQSMDNHPVTETTTLNAAPNLTQDLRINNTEPFIPFKSYQNEQFVLNQLKMLEGKELKLWGIGNFAGDDLASGVIRKLTQSSWSHVALIIVDQTDCRYCFESTASYDEIMHKGIFPQVRISPWSNVCDVYSGVIASRQFIFAESHQNNTKAVGDLVHSLIGKPYEENLVSLVEAIKGKNKKKDISSIFCSELVAEVMQELGYLKNDKLSDNYLPKDFSTEMTLSLINAALGDEIMIKGKKFDEGEMFESDCCSSCILF